MGDVEIEELGNQAVFKPSLKVFIQLLLQTFSP